MFMKNPDAPLEANMPKLFTLSNFFKSREVLLIQAISTAVWIFLLRLPVLMGDDRFFANASGLPAGKQTAGGIIRLIKKLILEYNGRLADPLGALWFGMGNNLFRTFMAINYPLMAFLLTLMLIQLVKLPNLSNAHSYFDPIKLLILANCIPFLICFIYPTLAGQGVFLFAAIWNYILPINVILIVLFVGSVTLDSRNTAGRKIFVTGFIFALTLSLMMHEILTIAFAGSVFAFILMVGVKRAFKNYLPLLLGTAGGTVGKFLTPGLWRRANRPIRPDDNEIYINYSFGRLRALNGIGFDIAKHYWVLFLLFSAIVCLVFIKLQKLGVVHKQARIFSVLQFWLSVVWLSFANIYIILISSARTQNLNVSLWIKCFGEALTPLCFIAAIICQMYVIFVVAKYIKIFSILYSALFWTVLATAIANKWPYVSQARALYLPALIAGVVIIYGLCYLVEDMVLASAYLFLPLLSLPLGFLIAVEPCGQIMSPGNRLGWRWKIQRGTVM